MSGPPPPKWIKLTKPACVLNGTRVTPWQGDQTEMIPEGEMPADFFKRVKPGMTHLIINCHGVAGKQPLLMLGWDLRPWMVDDWKILASLKSLKVIWIAACNMPGSPEGRQFCFDIADRAQAYVAGQIGPAIDRKGRKGFIDDPYNAMPVYFDPFGENAVRQKFLQAGRALGFEHPDVAPLDNPPARP